MSRVSDVATVHMLLADFAQADPAGRLNIIGGGISVVGRALNFPVTAPFSLAVTLEVPPANYGDECTVEITLEAASGEIVPVPDSTPGEPRPMVQLLRTARFDEPKPLSHMRFPETLRRGYLPGRVQLVIGLPGGLPLASGAGYLWRVKIDGEASDQWTHRFIVAEQVIDQTSP